MSEYHIPVMLHECINAMDIQPDKVYVDVTFGAGGHSKEILKKLGRGKLFSFDQDPEAVANSKPLEGENFQLVKANFRHLKKYLRLYGIEKVDGILADLGISSHQIDTPERGFSTRFDGELDMRMNKGNAVSAKTIVNEWEEQDIVKILWQYGELKNSRRIAQAIATTRAIKPIKTTFDLKGLLEPIAPRGKEFKFYAQVFQALRIEVNDELGALKEMLEQSAELLDEDGKLVVMSYHSLEDRLVKNFIRSGSFEGKQEKDFYGNLIRPLKPKQSKAISASAEEIAENSRARSAKLRVGIKLKPHPEK